MPRQGRNLLQDMLDKLGGGISSVKCPYAVQVRKVGLINPVERTACLAQPDCLLILVYQYAHEHSPHWCTTSKQLGAQVDLPQARV